MGDDTFLSFADREPMLFY